MTAGRGGVRAVLIDSYGTLVELEPPAPRLRALLAERFGLDVDHSDCAAAIAAEITYYRRHLQEGRDDASVDALRDRCAEVLFTALGSAGGAAIAGSLRSLDTRSRTQTLLDSLVFRAFADVQPALAALRAAGLRIVVASNWDASLPATLGRVGLFDAVDHVVTSGGFGVAKPDARLFERALALAGVAAGEAVHVGDSAGEDVAGARAAGVEPVLLSRTGEPGPAGVLTIRTLAELVPLLAARARADQVPARSL